MSYDAPVRPGTRIFPQSGAVFPLAATVPPSSQGQHHTRMLCITQYWIHPLYTWYMYILHCMHTIAVRVIEQKYLWGGGFTKSPKHYHYCSKSGKIVVTDCELWLPTHLLWNLQFSCELLAVIPAFVCSMKLQNQEHCPGVVAAYAPGWVPDPPENRFPGCSASCRFYTQDIAYEVCKEMWSALCRHSCLATRNHPYCQS